MSTTLTVGLFTIIGILVDIWFIKNEYAGEMEKATVLKGLASLMFVAIGAYLCMNYPSIGGRMILIGLLLGMVGDILLNMRNLYEGSKSNKIFALGILAFLAGHFMYIAFLARAAGPNWYVAIILTVILAVIAIPPLMKRIIAPSKGLKIFGYVYLTVVIAMFSFSVAQVVTVGITAESMLFYFGALLFVVSDFIMIYYSFGKKIKPLRAINLLSYYVGQLLIAYCIYYLK